MSGPGFAWRSLPSEEDRARRATALERREKFERRHPEIKIATRRDGGRLLFEVSEPVPEGPDGEPVPGDPARAYDNATAMMDDLERRYPG